MKANIKNRILSYDIIRILAIAMVVMIHSSARFVTTSSVPSIDFAWGNFFDAISRAAVPLFIMLSGALMLNEDRAITKKKMGGYIKGVATLLCFWSCLYAFKYSVIDPLASHDAISWGGVFRAFLLGHYHLWFLYMILGLYAITPILRLFVKRQNSKYILYFIILSVIFKFAVPSISFLLNCIGFSGSLFEDFVSKFNMGFVSIYVAYYLTGWYIVNNCIEKNKRVLMYILGLLGVIVAIVGARVLNIDNPAGYKLFYSNGNVNIFLYSVALFIILFYAFYDVQIESQRIRTLITKASTMSFGVYVVHVFVLNTLRDHFFVGASGCSIPLVWFLTILISYAITWMASKIPYVNKLFKC